MGMNHASTVSNHGHNVSICSSTVVNLSTAVMSHSGFVDESYRHCRTLVRHYIDADFLFSQPDAPRFYRLAEIGMQLGRNRDGVTEA